MLLLASTKMCIRDRGCPVFDAYGANEISAAAFECREQAGLHFMEDAVFMEVLDVETGEQGKAHPSEVRDAYRTAMADRWHRLKLKCGQYRIDLVEADINAGFEPVLLEFLTKRARLY